MAPPKPSGREKSRLSQFREHHPFDHPFFNRLRPSWGFFGSQPPRTRSHSLPTPANLRKVKIEEISEHGTPSTSLRCSGKPKVEHPDDEIGPGSEKDDTDFNWMNRGESSSQPYQATHSCSYSSASVSYGGPEGTYYSACSRKRESPDGVVEEEYEEKDSSTGKEIRRISRGMGDKGHSVTYHRDARGRQERREILLHNLKEEEVRQFDETWEDIAQRSLIGGWWNPSKIPRLGSCSQGLSRSQAQLALPSSRHTWSLHDRSKGK